MRDGSHRQDEAPFCVLSVFFALFAGCFLFDWGFFIPNFETFPPEGARSDQTSGCACTQPSQTVQYSAAGSSGHAVSRATSPPAIDPDGGCEQAPDGYSQISESQLAFQSQRTSFW